MEHPMKKRLYSSIAAVLFGPGLLWSFPMMAQDTAASMDINALIKPLRGPLVGPVLASSTASQSYKDFLKAQQAIRFDQLPTGAKVESQAAFDDMLHYFKNVYDGLDVTQTVTIEGEDFDCIPIKQQPSLRGDLSIDTDVPVALASGTTTSSTKQTSALVHQGAQSCAAGSIPFQRIRLDRLVQYPTLQNAQHARRVHPMAAPLHLPNPASIPKNASCPEKGYSTTEPDGSVHEWLSVSYPDVTAHGAMATLSLSQPKIYSLNSISDEAKAFLLTIYPDLNFSDRDSISQVWLTTLNNCGQLQSVESGTQVAPWWGTDRPVLFVYSTMGDYRYDQIDGYNLDGGFVQISKNVALGQALPLEKISGPGNDVSEKFEWIQANGKWYFVLGQEIVGYYLASRFPYGGLSENKPTINFAIGGEIVAKPDDIWTRLRRIIHGCDSCAPEMGSGAPAREGYGKAAYAKDINYLTFEERENPELYMHNLELVRTAFKNSTAEVTTVDNDNAHTGYVYSYHEAGGIFDAVSNPTGFPIYKQSYNDGAAFYFGGDGVSK
jgi:hypothetical protein